MDRDLGADLEIQAFESSDVGAEGSVDELINDLNQESEEGYEVEVQREASIPIVSRRVEQTSEVEEIVGKFMDENASAAHKKTANEMFFILVACIAGDAVQQEDPGRQSQILEMAAIKCGEALENYPRKDYAQPNLFAYLPEHTWPSSFVQWVSDKKANIMGLDKLKCANMKHLGAIFGALSFEHKKLRMFGQLIWKTFQDARATIHNHLNIHWNEDALPSGWSLSSLFLAIREYLYPKTREANFQRAINERIKYLRYKTKDEEGARELEENKEQTLREKMSAVVFDDYFYPKEWLVFVLLAKPAGKDARQVFAPQTFCPKKSIAAMRPSSPLRGRMSRKVRKTMISSGSGEEMEDGNSSTTRSKKSKLVNNVVIEHRIIPSPEATINMQSTNAISCLREELLHLHAMVSEFGPTTANEERIREVSNLLAEQLRKRSQEALNGLANLEKRPDEKEA